MEKSLGENEFGFGKVVPKHIVLIDREIILVARIDFHQADATALELKFPDALHHDIGIAPVAAVTHILHRDRDLSSHRLRMGATHRIDERRFAIEWNDDIAAERVPFPMAGEPEHAAAKTPVAGAARHDDDVELVFAHLGAQRSIAALVFLSGKLLVDRVPIVGRIAHIGERQCLVELATASLPGLRADTRRRNRHVHREVLRTCGLQELQAPVARVEPHARLRRA